MNLTGKMLSAVEDALGHLPDDETINAAVTLHEGKSTKELEAALTESEGLFNLAGGRGVELADEIDSLRTALAIRHLTEETKTDTEFDIHVWAKPADSESTTLYTVSEGKRSLVVDGTIEAAVAAFRSRLEEE